MLKLSTYKLIWIVFFILIASKLQAQFYIRGQVKDIKGNPIHDVNITLVSKSQYQYKSGSDGSFGIPTNKLNDSLIFEFEGYEVQKIGINSKHFVNVILQMLPETLASIKTKLNSQIINTENATNQSIYGFGESYTQTIENDVITTIKSPETNYTLNVDRASYSNIRRFLANKYKPPTEAVRTEEMLNYFDFSIKDEVKDNFLINTGLTSCPWNAKKNLLFVQTQAPNLEVSKITPSNFVFLIDVSGSMDKPNRLPLVQGAFKLLIKNLRAIDSVAIVTYGGGVHVLLPSTNCKNVAVIHNIIDSLSAVGDTPGEGAIKIAYEIAKKSYINNGNNRVVLATDGDFNVGQTSEKDLEELISLQKSKGIYLTCLGVGMGNYKDSKLESLAKKGDGNFAYLDNLKEAEKVLVQEFTKTMYAVAKDAFINIKFNANNVLNYRLLGYDNKKEALAETGNILEGGEVGSGHTNITIFEIELLPNAKDSLIASGSLNYISNLNNQFIQNFDVINSKLDNSYNFISKYKLAASIAWFASLLKQSKHTKESSFLDLIPFAKKSINQNNYIEAEFFQLIINAATIYEPAIMKKKKNRTLF